MDCSRRRRGGERPWTQRVQRSRTLVPGPRRGSGFGPVETRAKLGVPAQARDDEARERRKAEQAAAAEAAEARKREARETREAARLADDEAKEAEKARDKEAKAAAAAASKAADALEVVGRCASSGKPVLAGDDRVTVVCQAGCEATFAELCGNLSLYALREDPSRPVVLVLRERTPATNAVFVRSSGRRGMSTSPAAAPPATTASAAANSVFDRGAAANSRDTRVPSPRTRYRLAAWTADVRPEILRDNGYLCPTDCCEFKGRPSSLISVERRARKAYNEPLELRCEKCGPVHEAPAVEKAPSKKKREKKRAESEDRSKKKKQRADSEDRSKPKKRADSEDASKPAMKIQPGLIKPAPVSTKPAPSKQKVAEDATPSVWVGPLDAKYTLRGEMLCYVLQEDDASSPTPQRPSKPGFASPNDVAAGTRRPRRSTARSSRRSRERH